MTINSTAAILLLMYELVAEERGVPSTAISGTIQNDLLKEYIARGTYVYPPKPSMRIITNIFEYCSKNVPKWNTISISGYHIREAGSTAVQEVAFTLANGKAFLDSNGWYFGFTLLPADTAGIESTTYLYDIIVTTLDGDVTRAMQGTISLTPRITK
jgi:hypothetical protein